MPLSGRPMIEWSVEAFRTASSVGPLVIAAPPGRDPGLNGDDLTVVDGGAIRAESVANALEAVETELVAIHDAARPLVTPELIEAVVATLAADLEAAGAIAATPVTDTIKQVAEGQATHGRPKPFAPPGGSNPSFDVGATLDRGRLWAAQTPQVFRVAALRDVLGGDPDRIGTATDEAMLVEAAGERVLIHPSPPENLKVTTPLDLRLAELLLAERSAQ